MAGTKKNYNKLALALHKKLKGKLETHLKHPLKHKDDWSTMYTPGVGAVASFVAQKPEEARNYTSKGNSVAIISDGSAVLGLGNIGPYGALPVMEGKAAILKAQAHIDSWPIVLATQDVDEIVATIKAIAPTFGAINLEDFSAPRCFEIEKRLKAELDIPVMHDDQHGTAIVVLAGLINAFKITNRKFKDARIVIQGAGAAGVAIAKLIKLHAPEVHIVMLDSKGILGSARKDIAPYKKQLIKEGVIASDKDGNLLQALAGADVVIGVSGPGTISRHHIEQMAGNAIVFALANPVPEIYPEDAARAGATVVASGRSDFPNQVNNSLVFPGIFRGALDRRVQTITDDMKLCAAKKLAALVKRPTAGEIIPHISNPKLMKTIASAVR